MRRSPPCRTNVSLAGQFLATLAFLLCIPLHRASAVTIAVEDRVARVEVEERFHLAGHGLVRATDFG